MPAQIGVEFGIVVQVRPEFEGNATVYVEHPPQGTDGTVQESWPNFFSASEPTYVGFSFEYDYELTPGPWTLSARREGELIYEIEFDVVQGANLLSCEMQPQIS